MAAFVVMENENAASARAVFVRQGFTWLAFLVPAVWLLWHRLWIEAALAVAGALLLSAAGEAAGLGPYASLLALLLSLYFGLEATTLRLRALTRRGWREWGVIEAYSADDAELRYLAAIGDEAGADPEPFEPLPPAPSLPAARPTSPARSIGLVPYSGRA